MAEQRKGWTPATFDSEKGIPRPFDTCAICGRRGFGRWWQLGDVRAFRCDPCADYEVQGCDDPHATIPERMSRAELIRRHKGQAQNYRTLLDDFDRLRLAHAGAEVKIAVLETIERTGAFSGAKPELTPQCSNCGRREVGWYYTPLSYFCFGCKPVTESWEYLNAMDASAMAIEKAGRRISTLRKQNAQLALKLVTADAREAKLWKRVERVKSDESRWHDMYTKERTRGARIEKELAEARKGKGNGKQATANPDPGLPFCGCRVKHVENGREGLVFAASWSRYPSIWAPTGHCIKVRWNDDNSVTEIRDPSLLQVIERPQR